MGIPRKERRRLARANHGMSLGQFKRTRAKNERQQKEALWMTPEEARKKLAEWGAQPGRTQTEIDWLNGQMQKEIGQ